MKKSGKSKLKRGSLQATTITGMEETKARRLGMSRTSSSLRLRRTSTVKINIIVADSSRGLALAARVLLEEGEEETKIEIGILKGMTIASDAMTVARKERMITVIAQKEKEAKARKATSSNNLCQIEAARSNREDKKREKMTIG